jgi:hypothetical protein
MADVDCIARPDVPVQRVATVWVPIAGRARRFVLAPDSGRAPQHRLLSFIAPAWPAGPANSMLALGRRTATLAPRYHAFAVVRL